MLKEIVNQGNKCIVLNIFESGSQHVDTIHTQHISLTPNPSPKREGEKPTPGPSLKGGEVTLPEVLATEEAMKIWQKVQDAGYIDTHYQPLLSRTQSALLADAIAVKLGIRQKWKTFETLWNRKNVRSDYNLALRQQQSLDFQGELKRIL